MTQPNHWHRKNPGVFTSTASHESDIATEFLARKQAILRVILSQFPALPRLAALFVAYCTVFCVCFASLVVLFVGSFVLTCQDQVVARFRWLVDATGLGGQAGAVTWWAKRAAMGLAAAIVDAVKNGDPGRRKTGSGTPKSTGTNRSRPRDGSRSNRQDDRRQSRRERPSSSTRGQNRSRYYSSTTRGFADTYSRTL